MRRRQPKPAGVEASPRHRERGKADGKKSETSVDEKPTYIDRSRLSKAILRSTKVLIAESIMAFSEMEASADALIWALIGVSYDDGRYFTKMDAKQKFDLAKALSKRHGVAAPTVPKGKTGMWTAIETLTEVRNKMAHGLWGTLDHKVAVCASYRMPAESGQITAECFPRSRFEAFIRQAKKITACLDGMTEKAQASRATRDGQSPKPKPSPMPNQ